VARVAEIPAALDAVGVHRPCPVLVLVGGAGGMDERDQRALDEILRIVVVPLLTEHAATLVDGGTDSGIMRVVGRAGELAIPLVGVAAEGTVVVPGGAPAVDDPAELEPHHTHVVLVPGTHWGDESPWLADVADVIAGRHPSFTLVVNGGGITYDDVARSIGRGRPVVVLAGTGRAADEIAAARAGRPADPRATAVSASALVRVVALDDVDDVRGAVDTLLS
jgi:hypothetical protein